MATAALGLGRNVIHRLGFGHTGIMAGGTVAAHRCRVMDEGPGKGGKGRGGAIMADRTVLRGGHMVRRFTLADGTVMAGGTVVDNAAVGECCPHKGSRIMAVGTVLVIRISRDMIRQLANTDAVIVTAITATAHPGMVIGAGGKSARGMTETAILAIDRHMRKERGGKRQALRGARAIGDMTGHATVRRYPGMVDKGAGKRGGVMAGAAIGRGGRVVRER